MNKKPPVKNKARDFKKSMKKLFGYIASYKVILIIAIMFSLVGTTCAVLGPKKLGEISNVVQLAIEQGIDVDFNKINNIGITLAFMYLGVIVFNFFCGFCITQATQSIGKKLRREISEKINKLPLKYFDTRSYGDILSRVTNDVDTVTQNFNDALSSIIQSVMMLLGIIVMMLSISLQLTGIAFATIPVSMLVMVFIIKFSQKYFRIQQKTLGALNGHIEEAYSGHMVIKAFNQEANDLERFCKYNDELRKTAWKSQFFSALMMPAIFFIGNLSYIVISLVAGTLAVTSNNISVNLAFWQNFTRTDYIFIATGMPLLVGGIQSFIIYSRQFNNPLQQIAQISNILQSCAAAFERVVEFLSEEELEKENPQNVLLRENVKGTVEFKNINFGYTEEKQIIFDFNVKVEPGQKVAIVGPTGAGKTTIVNLLMRFYEVNSGDILIDGISTKSISRENTASLFGMVLQDTWLFEGTILENLKYGKQDATFEEVVKACKACHIDHFIRSLSDGYNHFIDENASVSQGQKQLITIARSMIANSPMLILDEATSSVDTRTEVLIQKAMDELMKGRTSFVIAHRLSTIKNADIILVMNNGNIIESGSHDELMIKDGFYTSLYNSQFSEEME